MRFSKLAKTGAVFIAIIFFCAIASAKSTTKKLPSHFRAYASEAISHGQRCVVGVSTDEDGMSEKPVGYLLDANRLPRWVAQLDVPKEWYEARATHCTRRGDALFVLVQTDTNSAQTLSQTVLSVVKLYEQTGAVKTQREVFVPDAYSAWVPGDTNNFFWRANRLVITGNQRPNADRESIVPFSVQLDEALNVLTMP